MVLDFLLFTFYSITFDSIGLQQPAYAQSKHQEILCTVQAGQKKKYEGKQPHPQRFPQFWWFTRWVQKLKMMIKNFKKWLKEQEQPSPK